MEMPFAASLAVQAKGVNEGYKSTEQAEWDAISQNREFSGAVHGAIVLQVIMMLDWREHGIGSVSLAR